MIFLAAAIIFVGIFVSSCVIHDHIDAAKKEILNAIKDHHEPPTEPAQD